MGIVEAMGRTELGDMGPLEVMEPLCFQGINLMINKKKTDREKKEKE